MSPNKPKKEKPQQEQPAKVDREALAQSIKDKKKALTRNQIIKK